MKKYLLILILLFSYKVFSANYIYVNAGDTQTVKFEELNQFVEVGTGSNGNTGFGQYQARASIDEAITDASNGDTIAIVSGTYTTIFNGANVTKQLYIYGLGYPTITLTNERGYYNSTSKTYAKRLRFYNCYFSSANYLYGAFASTIDNYSEDIIFDSCSGKALFYTYAGTSKNFVFKNNSLDFTGSGQSFLTAYGDIVGNTNTTSYMVMYNNSIINNLTQNFIGRADNPTRNQKITNSIIINNSFNNSIQLIDNDLSTSESNYNNIVFDNTNNSGDTGNIFFWNDFNSNNYAKGLSKIEYTDTQAQILSNNVFSIDTQIQILSNNVFDFDTQAQILSNNVFDFDTKLLILSNSVFDIDTQAGIIASDVFSIDTKILILKADTDTIFNFDTQALILLSDNYPADTCNLTVFNSNYTDSENIIARLIPNDTLTLIPLAGQQFFNNENITFQWDIPKGANTIFLQTAKDSNYTIDTTQDTITGINQSSFQKSFPDIATYYWRGQAKYVP